MICPGCCTVNLPFAYNKIYQKCSGCGTITATLDIGPMVETENDKPQLRNTPEANLERINRAVDTLGCEPDFILDFGCGGGELIGKIQRNFPNTCVLGIDASTAHFLKYLRLGLFDIIFMVEVLEHLQQPLHELLHIHQILTSGGVVYVETTFADSIPNYQDHPYIDPKIGHRTILSKKAMRNLCKGLFDVAELNDNVMLLKKL